MGDAISDHGVGLRERCPECGVCSRNMSAHEPRCSKPAPPPRRERVRSYCQHDDSSWCTEACHVPPPAPKAETWEHEGFCPKRADGKHCKHWWDEHPCCDCGHGAPKAALDNKQASEHGAPKAETRECLIHKTRRGPEITLAILDEAKDPRDRALELAAKALKEAFRAQRDVVNEHGSGFDDATLGLMLEALDACRAALKGEG